MHEYLLSFSLIHPFLVYLVIVLIGIIEGPILSLFLGGLLFLGYFKFIPVYLFLMLADLIGDTFWYYAGYHYGYSFVSRFGKYFMITEDHIDKVKKMFDRHKNYILFFSKITNGLGFPGGVLFTAGLSQIPFGRYITINFFGQIFWSGLLLSTGYFFSNMYVQIDNLFGRLSLIVFGLILLILIFRYGRLLNKKIDN